VLKNKTIANFVIFLVVLYGLETRSMALREEYRLSVFETGVLRRIFGSRR
jgi:hypothetical protein